MGTGGEETVGVNPGTPGETKSKLGPVHGVGGYCEGGNEEASYESEVEKHVGSFLTGLIDNKLAGDRYREELRVAEERNLYQKNLENRTFLLDMRAKSLDERDSRLREISGELDRRAGVLDDRAATLDMREAKSSEERSKKGYTAQQSVYNCGQPQDVQQAMPADNGGAAGRESGGSGVREDDLRESIMSRGETTFSGRIKAYGAYRYTITLEGATEKELREWLELVVQMETTLFIKPTYGFVGTGKGRRLQYRLEGLGIEVLIQIIMSIGSKETIVLNLYGAKVSGYVLRILPRPS